MDRPSKPTVENLLEHPFRDRELLAEALRHSSFVNEASEAGLRDNERLEFLGDAVLSLAVGHLLLERFPHFKEGELTRMRAGLVNEPQLAGLARNLTLGDHLQLGKGESQSGGHSKSSILAGAFEALMAAVYLDGGYATALGIVTRLFQPLIEWLDRSGEHTDHKSQLQELVQARPGAMPSYTVVHEAGPDHDKTFQVALRVLDIDARGTGKSKKAAEQDAARRALELLSAGR
jgi:ribonuclease III